MIPVLLAAVLTLVTQDPGFDATFTGRTLRFDYNHAGKSGEEHVALRGMRLEGPWAGPRARLTDDLNLGQFRVRILDTKTKRLLYAHGFGSIFGEWQTTGEAKTAWRAIEESVRFPEPKAPFTLALDRRSDGGTFEPIFSGDWDTEGRTIDRSPITPRGEVITLMDNGPAAKKVDMLFLAEGYTADQREKFRGDATRVLGALFETEPYKRHRTDFNVRGIFLPAAQAGISNPRKGIWRDSPFGCTFNSFDSDRYVLTLADRNLREIAAQAPYDALVILFNDRKYGGGGIYGLWSTCAADSSEANYLLVHEFGHAFAGLADEYYTSQVAYEQFPPPGTEPWEPNVTALRDPKALKWRDLVDADTPLPSPWNQAAYDATDLALQAKRKDLIEKRGTDEAMEALFGETKSITSKMLESEKLFGKVGAFEGANYQAKGYFRPELDCIMFTRNPKRFCKVCERAIETVIASYLD